MANKSKKEQLPSDPEGASSRSPAAPLRSPGGESCSIVLRPTAPPVRRLFFPIDVCQTDGLLLSFAGVVVAAPLCCCELAQKKKINFRFTTRSCFLCLTAAASGKNKLAKLLKSLVRHLQGKSVENIEIQRLEGDILNCRVAYGLTLNSRTLE